MRMLLPGRATRVEGVGRLRSVGRNGRRHGLGAARYAGREVAASFRVSGAEAAWCAFLGCLTRVREKRTRGQSNHPGYYSAIREETIKKGDFF